MKKVLYISYFAPYDTVDHAGGKVHNFYVKKMQREKELDVTLLTMCYKREVSQLDLERYGIDYRLVVLDQNRRQKLWRKFYSGFSYFNPWDSYSGVLLNYERHCLKKMIREYAAKNVLPDLIVLQWTQIVLLLPYIRTLYPKVPVVAIEEDVLFLNFYRQIGLAENFLRKQIAQYRYRNMRAKELQALADAQLVVTNNPKDGKLYSIYWLSDHTAEDYENAGIYWDDVHRIIDTATEAGGVYAKLAEKAAPAVKEFDSDIDSSLDVDTTDEDKYYSFALKDGTALKATELQEGDVLSIAYDVKVGFSSSNSYTAIVSRDTVEGKVTRVNVDSNDKENEEFYNLLNKLILNIKSNNSEEYNSYIFNLGYEDKVLPNIKLQTKNNENKIYLLLEDIYDKTIEIDLGNEEHKDISKIDKVSSM